MGEMYTDRLLDHYRRPRNKGRLEAADASTVTGQVLAAREYNPLCGDEVTLEVLIEDDRIKDARFDGRGCALCMGAASILTEAVQGRTLEELGSVVRPGRLRCALLPWMAFRHAVFGEDDWSLLDNGSEE